MAAPKTIRFWRGRLPHWEVEDGQYFVTVRLKGALPRAGIERIQELAASFRFVDREDDEAIRQYQRTVFSAVEEWLHKASLLTHLHDPRVAEMVMEAIEFRQQRHVWNMHEYVVMPNHLHLFFETGDGAIKEVLEDFKRWTATRANQILELTGRFWQIEWFDHWSRSYEESEKIVRYIRENPVKAGLILAGELWPYGSAAFRAS